MIRLIAAVIFVVVAAKSMAGEGNSFVDIYKRVNQVSLVRIVSAELSGLDGECRYRYRVNVERNYKGEAPSEFYYPSSMALGTKYLSMANIDDRCGKGTSFIDLYGLPALYPLLPYGFDIAESDAWVAVGGAYFAFPEGVRSVGDYRSCYVRVEVGIGDPCLVPPPLVRFEDLEGLLRRLGKANVDDEGSGEGSRVN